MVGVLPQDGGLRLEALQQLVGGEPGEIQSLRRVDERSGVARRQDLIEMV